MEDLTTFPIQRCFTNVSYLLSSLFWTIQTKQKTAFVAIYSLACGHGFYLKVLRKADILFSHSILLLTSLAKKYFGTINCHVVTKFSGYYGATIFFNHVKALFTHNYWQNTLFYICVIEGLSWKLWTNHRKAILLTLIAFSRVLVFGKQHVHVRLYYFIHLVERNSLLVFMVKGRKGLDMFYCEFENLKFL